MNRCHWCNLRNPRYVAYHDHEWGRPVTDDRRLFELLLLETFQAGLSWECVLNKRDAFGRAFADFDVQRVARYDEADIERLCADATIIRNRLKIRAAVANARIFIRLQSEFGSFAAYLQGFTRGEVVREVGPTTSPLSDAISRDLRRRGMTFVGSVVVYSYLQAIGVINGHEPDCFLYEAY